MRIEDCKKRLHDVIGAAPCEQLIYVDHLLGMAERAVYAVNHAQILLARCGVHPGLVARLLQAIILAEDPATAGCECGQVQNARKSSLLFSRRFWIVSPNDT